MDPRFRHALQHLYLRKRLTASDKNLIMPELKIDAGSSKAKSNYVKHNSKTNFGTYQIPELNIPGTKKHKMNESQIKVKD